MRNYEGNSSVFAVAQFFNNKILALLLGNGGDPNIHFSEEALYNTPLMIAALNDNVEGVRLLVKAGANCNYRNLSGNTALSVIDVSENLELKALIESCSSNP